MMKKYVMISGAVGSILFVASLIITGGHMDIPYLFGYLVLGPMVLAPVVRLFVRLQYG